MKTYLNSNEKMQLSILLSMSQYIKNLTVEYSQYKRSKLLLKWLRTSHSFLEKALHEFLAPLDKKGTDVALKAAGKMRLIARTSEEALKEIQKIKEHDSHISIPNEQFLVLCSFTLLACKECVRADYDKCVLRDIFMEYDIDPIYSVSNQCQYQHKEISENAYFNVLKCDATGELFRTQPGLNLSGFSRYRTAPLTKEFWSLPKITTE